VNELLLAEWERIQKTLEQATAPAKQIPDIVDMDVDSAIASVLDLEMAQPPPSKGNPSAPKLKLKIGGQNGRSAGPSRLKIPLKKEKSKSVAVEDDASPDDFLLAEVMALENDRPRHDKPQEKEKAAKRDKHSEAPRPPSVVPVPQEKPTIKFKKLAPSETPSTSSTTLKIKPSQPQAAQNGPPAHSPRPTPPAALLGVPFSEKKCREVLKTLKKIPEAGIFLRPVNPELDGCPTYDFSSYTCCPFSFLIDITMKSSVRWI
jgi:transcription initiation factor TFIID subunit 2